MPDVIFIHIPKTAGMAIGDALAKGHYLKWGFQQNHKLGREKCLDADENTVILGVVRNPYDRLWSVFEFYKKKKGSLPDKLTFRDFIMQFEEKFHPKGFQFGTCFDYLTDAEGELLTTDIIRFENLCDEYATFCEKYGFTNKLKHINKNDKKEPAPEYTEEMRDVVERVFRRDLDTFEYSYDDYSSRHGHDGRVPASEDIGAGGGATDAR